MGVIDTIFFGTDYCFIKFSQKTKQKMLTEMGVIDTIFFSSKSFFLDSSCPLATLNVTAQVDLIWELRDVHLEPVLDLVEDFCIALVRHKGDGETFGSKPSSPGHSVQVGVSVLGHVVVEDNVDSLNVHATTEEVGGDKDSLLEILELLVARESLLLSHASVNGDGWEILLYEELGQSHTSLHGLDEDDDLVEFQNIEQLEQIPVFLRVLQLDVMLLEAVQSQLGLVVNVNLHGVLHELLADRPDVLAEGGGEHHHLLLVGSGPEDLLDVPPHVQLLQHLVTLVQHEMFQVFQWELFALDEGEDPAWSSHNNMRTVALQNLLILRDRHPSKKHSNLDVGEKLGEPLVLLTDLEGQLSGVTHHQHRNLSIHGLNLLESSQNKYSSFPHTGLGLAQNVHTQDSLGDALVLDLARMLKSTVYNGSQDLRLEQEVSETAAVDGDVVSLDGPLLLGLLSVLAGIGLLGIFLLFVVQKIIIDISVSHYDSNIFSLVEVNQAILA